MAYPFLDIEKKWQKYWADNKTFRAKNPSPGGGGKEGAPKYYALDMFPYPSGAGLHVGHPLGYIASDIVSRYKRLKGFNVLHPMGYDSFGLPAEQYAIQTGQHPAITTEQNIARYRQQMDKIGFSFDWEREVRTSDPNYYKWTQWIFLKLFNSWYNPETNKAEDISTLITKLNFNSLPGGEGWGGATNEKEKSDVLMEYRLAYLSEAWVNWCPQLGTVLANEEVKEGVSERGGYPVERKLMPQWSLRITAYAERLLNDLEQIDWSESIKESQRNWIGKSEGSSLRFRIASPPTPLQGRGENASKESGQYPGYHTAKKEIWEKLKVNSKANRKGPTEAEAILWERLRDNKLGYKIRRQHAIDKFIADFVCLDKKLIIEADGEIHLHQKEEDEGRTFMLEEIGYRLIRFTNDEIIEKTDWVCQKIEEALRAPFSFGEGRGDEACIEVFTTRPDTVFGVTFLTLAPESDLVSQLTTPEQKQKVESYVQYAKNRSERERQTEVKKVTGEFTGAYAIHPFTGKQIPIWIGDYVLAGYGTGAVMGVPAHDSRDHAFAKHFGLPIVKVIEPISPSPLEKGSGDEAGCYEAKEGKCINSDLLNGLDVKDAIKKIIAEIEKKNLGKGKTQYRLRDAIFGRQRYWGEPIPIYYKSLTPPEASGPSPSERGAFIPCAVEEKHLPIELPQIEKYLPTETGEPPLARAENWYYSPAKGISSPPLQGGDGGGLLELTTMPGWAGSSWYYLRYMDAHNEKEFAGKEALNYWKDVDLYIGGSEHATGHLLYVRFWTKFLFDLGYIPVIEPAKKLINQGMILGLSEKFFQQSIYKANGKKYISVRFNEKEKFQNIPIPDGVSHIYISAELRERKLVEIYPANHHSLNMPISLVENSILKSRKDFTSWHLNDDEAVFVCEGGFWYKETFFPFPENANGSKDFYTIQEVEKMSKSKFNVVTPDDICTNFGADTLRLYEMFLGPLEQSKPWNTNGISGVSGFLNKFWRLFHEETKVSNIERKEEYKVSEDQPTKAELKILHKTIKKIQEDIDNYSFNTAVSAFMICVNELTDVKCNKRSVLEPLVILLSPFAPHLAEELWEKLGHKESISFANFPEYNPEYLVESSFAYPVSFNGKMRFNIELALSLTPAEIEKEVLASEQSKKFLEGKQPKKVIVVPKRIVNIVV